LKDIQTGMTHTSDKPDHVRIPGLPSPETLEKIRDELEGMRQNTQTRTKGLAKRIHDLETVMGKESETKPNVVTKSAEESGVSIKQTLTVQDYDLGFNSTTNAIKITIPKTKLILPDHLNNSPVCFNSVFIWLTMSSNSPKNPHLGTHFHLQPPKSPARRFNRKSLENHQQLHSLLHN
jgi:hypothetical protein